MKEKGYKVSFLRSSGPTVEGGYRNHAWYAIATKKRSIKRAKPKRRRVSRNFGGLPNFKFRF